MAAFIANASVTAPHIQSVLSSYQTSQVAAPKDTRFTYHADTDKGAVKIMSSSSEADGSLATNLRPIGSLRAKSSDYQPYSPFSASFGEQGAVSGESKQSGLYSRLNGVLTRPNSVNETSQVQHGTIFAVSGSGGRPAASSTSNPAEDAMFTSVVYPDSILEEYDALTDKKYEEGLSTREAKRLQQLKEQMNTIDRTSPLVQSNLAKIDNAYRNLAALDQEIKILLKARRQEDTSRRDTDA